MISLVQPYLHLSAEHEERCAQQDNCEKEQCGSTVDMLQPQEGAREAYGKQQRGAYSACQREAGRVVQQGRTSPQPRKVRFEMDTRLVIGSDVIDVANAFNN
jgi:hypothetical protein